MRFRDEVKKYQQEGFIVVAAQQLSVRRGAPNSYCEHWRHVGVLEPKAVEQVLQLASVDGEDA